MTHSVSCSMTGYVCKMAHKSKKKQKKKEPHLCAVLFQTLQKTQTEHLASPNLLSTADLASLLAGENHETLHSGEAAILDMFQSCTRSQLQCICQTSADFRKPRVGVSLISLRCCQFFAKQLKEPTHHVRMPWQGHFAKIHWYQVANVLNLMFVILDVTQKRQIKSRHNKCLGSQQ